MIYYFPGIEGPSPDHAPIIARLPGPVHVVRYPEWHDMVRHGGGLGAFIPPTPHPTAFIGHSFGGIIAAIAAARHPGVPVIILDTDLERFTGSPSRPPRNRATIVARITQVRHAPTPAARMRRAVTLALDATIRTPLTRAAIRTPGRVWPCPAIRFPRPVRAALRWTLRRDMAELWLREHPITPTNVTLFRTADHPPEASRHLGWGNRSRVAHVPGDHVSMLQYKHLPGLVLQCLELVS